MFYRLREFTEGIGSLPTAGLGLVAGGAVGVLLTMQMSAGTPYSQDDLDRVSAHGRTASGAGTSAEATSALGGKAGRLDRLELRNERLADDLSAAKVTIANLRQQLDWAATASASASASAAASSSAAATVPGLPAATSPALPSTGSTGSTTSTPPPTTPSTGTSGVPVTGMLDVSWMLPSAAKPWPSSCAQVARGYRVRVTTGHDKLVALGVPTAYRETGRSTNGGILSLGCDVMWSATLPAPLSGVYELTAVGSSAQDKPLDTARVHATDLAAGKVPSLGVTCAAKCGAQG